MITCHPRLIVLTTFRYSCYVSHHSHMTEEIASECMSKMEATRNFWIGRIAALQNEKEYIRCRLDGLDRAKSARKFGITVNAAQRCERVFTKAVRRLDPISEVWRDYLQLSGISQWRLDAIPIMIDEKLLPLRDYLLGMIDRAFDEMRSTILRWKCMDGYIDDSEAVSITRNVSDPDEIARELERMHPAIYP